MEVFQDPVAEAGADVSYVAPCFVFAHGEDQGAEERPGAPRRREPGDYYFLSLCRLDLQPVGTAASGCVRTVGTLRHQAFQTLSLGLGEEFHAVLLAVTAEGDQPV